MGCWIYLSGEISELMLGIGKVDNEIDGIRVRIWDLGGWDDGTA